MLSLVSAVVATHSSAPVILCTILSFSHPRRQQKPAWITLKNCLVIKCFTWVHSVLPSILGLPVMFTCNCQMHYWGCGLTRWGTTGDWSTLSTQSITLRVPLYIISYIRWSEEVCGWERICVENLQVRLHLCIITNLRFGCELDGQQSRQRLLFVLVQILYISVCFSSVTLITPWRALSCQRTGQCPNGPRIRLSDPWSERL